MATIIQKPPDFGGVSPGMALGSAVGKGLSAFLNQRINEEKQERFLQGMQQFDKKIRSSKNIDEALAVNPFEFIPPAMLNDAEDITALMQFRSKRAKEMFPEQEALVNPEGELIGVIGEGRARPSGALTTGEFKDIQSGRVAREKARGGSMKFTLTDKKLQIIERMAKNEKAGRDRTQGITGTELDLVASDLSDPDRSNALRIALESVEFYTKNKTAAQKTEFVQTLIDVMKGLRQGRQPTPQQRSRLGDKVLQEVRQGGSQAGAGAGGERGLPPGITNEDVDATLRSLQNQGQRLTREQVIEALWNKYPKGLNSGR